MSAAPVADEPFAWGHEDGRVIPASTMKQALKDGGASKSSVAGYTIALAPRPAAQGPVADEPVARLRERIAALEVQVRQADERGDEAMRRAHAAEAELEAQRVPAERGEYPPLPEPAKMSSDQACRFGVWWAHKRKAFTTTRQAAWAAWTEASAYVDADRAQRVPLTDEQRDAIFFAVAGVGDNGPCLKVSRDGFRSVVSAVERAHKIGAKP